ncbi:hypothetical protein RIF29_27664 [Crotalaria pallida]|uniref:Uncharacterized protein n=1 Tax=Crotalaria pallida TaxID=3830 RepID=A0AAN9I2J8_CROPI
MSTNLSTCPLFILNLLFLTLRLKMKPGMEVAPSLLDFNRKPSNNIPKLETIMEDKDEEYDDEEDGLANL